MPSYVNVTEFKRCLALIIMFLLITGLSLNAKTNDDRDQIVILSPQGIQTVHPGETIEILGSTPEGNQIAGVIAVGEDPLGLAISAAGPRFKLAFHVPLTTRPRHYRILVSAKNASGEVIGRAVPVIVDIESTDTLETLTSQPSAITLAYIGDSTRLRISGMRPSGGSLNVTQSGKLIYTSADPTVARVNTWGQVTALKTGKTTISVVYEANQISVPVTVLNAIRGDLNGDGRVDLEDLSILQMWINDPRLGVNDARDLNHDGKIDEKDIEIMKGLIEEQRQKDKDKDPDRKPKRDDDSHLTK